MPSLVSREVRPWHLGPFWRHREVRSWLAPVVFLSKKNVFGLKKVSWVSLLRKRRFPGFLWVSSPQKKKVSWVKGAGLKEGP